MVLLQSETEWKTTGLGIHVLKHIPMSKTKELQDWTPLMMAGIVPTNLQVPRHLHWFRAAPKP